MAQDVPSAADTLADRTRDTVILKKPSVVHLYAEGGGVLGKMFTVWGDDWEKKTGIHFGLACHVKEGVSTGKPFITAISIPDPENPQRPLYWCSEINQMFDDDCSVMFAERPRRLFNLAASNGLSLAKRMFDPSESRADRAYIEKIKQNCDLLLAEVPDDKKKYVTSIRERASAIWLTSAEKVAILEYAKRISEDTPRNAKKKIEAYTATEPAKKYIEEIGNLLNLRTKAQKGWLTTVFMRTSILLMDTVKSKLGPRENRHHNPEIKQELFKKRMNDLELNNLIGSIVTAAFSPRKMARVLVYSLRSNLLDMHPDAPGVVSHPGMKAWDASMLTTANLLAFPGYRNKEGLFIDRATIHTPTSVAIKINKYKPKDTGIVSLTFSTGHIAKSELDDQQLFDYYAENGEFGNDTFLDEAKAYTTTASHEEIADLIGEENVLYMSPRMSWKDIDEEREFPSTNILDASRENMAKVQRRAEKFRDDKVARFNRTWQILADNMYLLGHIDKPKFDEITERLGVKAKLEAERAPESNLVDSSIVPFPAPQETDTPSAAVPSRSSPPDRPLTPQVA